ncbi:MAG: TerC/Alx family metal homeostasis membrane protein [Rickettsiales bacterium]|jgi:tellurite resistance protein TerC|nr:TerC/Alx family metal homeostasis membrane protein [Rickettsiales bacterium]
MLGDYSIGSVLIFAVVVAACLLIDLFAHRSDKPVSARSAALWTVFWIIVSLGFAGYVWGTHGSADSFAFLSGYVLEKALSIDNLFVMMAIFSSFHIAEKYQHRVLYYGILGALLLRMGFVAAGVGIIERFGDFATAAFGIFIVWSAFKMLQATGIGVLAYTMFMNQKKKKALRNAAAAREKEETDFSKHWSTRLFGRLFKVHGKVDGHKFFVRGAATPLFLCLITIEFADVMFAFDSVPAIIAITGKPFLVYTSNIFAILGMRSMYFCLAALKRSLKHLEKAVIATLVFIGFKMLGEVIFHTHIGPGLSLLVILGLMSAGVIWSLMDKKNDGKN